MNNPSSEEAVERLLVRTVQHTSRARLNPRLEASSASFGQFPFKNKVALWRYGIYWCSATPSQLWQFLSFRPSLSRIYTHTFFDPLTADHFYRRSLHT